MKATVFFLFMFTTLTGVCIGIYDYFGAAVSAVGVAFNLETYIRMGGRF